MKFAKIFALVAGASLLAASCADDLNLKPKYGLTAEQVYAKPENYINVLAKIYAGLSISGNNGPCGHARYRRHRRGLLSVHPRHV